MDIARTLVAYVSKGGASEDAAKIVADVLQAKFGFTVDVVNLKRDRPNISGYNNIVVGAGVRAGKVYDEALKFLNQDFGTRKVAFFVCCGGAGDPKTYNESCTKYLVNVLAKFPNLRTVATDAFGGCMKVLGKQVFDTRDPAKVNAWAETVGKQFTEEP
jgi:menaquinone-dependent protoporphyrinogen oxidase